MDFGRMSPEAPFWWTKGPRCTNNQIKCQIGTYHFKASINAKLSFLGKNTKMVILCIPGVLVGGLAAATLFFLTGSFVQAAICYMSVGIIAVALSAVYLIALSAIVEWRTPVH